jgi:probable addiction module antidote protein
MQKIFLRERPRPTLLRIWQRQLEEAGDDATYIAAVLGDIAKARGIMTLADATGMTRQGLYKALAPDSNPIFATILKMTKAVSVALDFIARDGNGPEARYGSSPASVQFLDTNQPATWAAF